MRTAELYNNSEYSDLTIRLGDGRDIRVHKVIVCRKNRALRRLCQNNMAILELNDDTLAVETLLRFLYKHNFDDVEGSFLFWLRVRAVARKYEQNTLPSLAAAKLKGDVLALYNAGKHEEVIGAIETLELWAAADEDLARFTDTLRSDLGLGAARRALFAPV